MTLRADYALSILPLLDWEIYCLIPMLTLGFLKRDPGVPFSGDLGGESDSGISRDISFILR